MKKLNWNWTQSKGVGNRKVPGSGKEYRMRIQVATASITKDKVIHIFGESIDDLRRCRDERGRTDRIQMREFQFNTRNKYDLKYIVWLLHDQKTTQNCKTYGDAVQAIIGTTIDIKKTYQVFDN